MAPRLPRRWALLALLLGSASGQAAPLDTLLTATPERATPRLRLELGLDLVNRSLDFSTSADPASQNPATTAGGYRGAQLLAAWRASDRLWLSGGLRQQRISNAVDHFDYSGWQLAGQWRLADAAGAWPALALRLGAWGNRAAATEATTPVRVPGAILDTVTVDRPADRQVQVDLLATWALSPRLDVSAVLGAGRTQLRYAGLRATTTRNGCPYNLVFNGNDIFGSLARACTSTGGGVIRQFYDSSGDYGVDVAREIAWGGHFVQAGANLRWISGDWQWAGGYLFHTMRRQHVDSILARRGDPVHRHNHVFMAEVAYQVRPQLSLFGRAQLSSHLFLNDIPVTYNTSTSGSFGNRLSLLTLGLRADF
ncbi:MAG: hypothetical protein V4795_03330 [Pseudomonadota bacterium]